MVSINRKRIRCVVVSVQTDFDPWAERGALAQDIVPGADPYVAQLIRRLQDEVRAERQAEQRRAHKTRFTPANRLVVVRRIGSAPGLESLSADLEIPWFDMPADDAPLADDYLPELGTESNEDPQCW
jgi:hypothetical protein